MHTHNIQYTHTCICIFTHIYTCIYAYLYICICLVVCDLMILSLSNRYRDPVVIQSSFVRNSVVIQSLLRRYPVVIQSLSNRYSVIIQSLFSRYPVVTQSLFNRYSTFISKICVTISFHDRVPKQGQTPVRASRNVKYNYLLHASPPCHRVMYETSSTYLPFSY